MPAGAPPDRILQDFLDVYEEAEYAALTALTDALACGAKKKDRMALVAQAAELTRLRTHLAGITRQLNQRVGPRHPENARGRSPGRPTHVHTEPFPS
ncbi:hypothetical protein [Pseudonocardia sp. TRM90224]|uniref:hypothetical protein n=1 Tax=Pseudonocardia sp. TRM90224 TaxID=2812678 RepID=UPI001E2C8150|nr:hypothetical protein [Pseudonocardia sp. TRM90224]